MLLAVHNASWMDTYMDSCWRHRHVAILFIKSPLRWRVPHMRRHIPWLVKKLQVCRRLHKAHLYTLWRNLLHTDCRALMGMIISSLAWISRPIRGCCSCLGMCDRSDLKWIGEITDNLRLILQIICVDDSNVLTLRSCSYRHSRRYDLMIYKIVSKMVILWRSQ